MTSSPVDPPESSEIERAAAEWTIRIDRQLSAQDQDEYTQWLAADPRHRQAMALYQWGWDELDRLAGLRAPRFTQVDSHPAANQPKARRRLRRGRWGVAVSLSAAVMVLAALWFNAGPTPGPNRASPAVHLLTRIERLTLEDGSKIDLNRGARIETVFSPAERRVRLVQGEVSFNVAKDPDRPFVVNVAGVDVRAVGTVFNVRLADESVDVIVSEGKVKVAATSASEFESSPEEFPLLEIGQRAHVKIGQGPVRMEVTQLSAEELTEALCWLPRMLDFDATPLVDIVEQFNRRNSVQIMLEGDKVESVKLSSTFWSDNVEGFVRLMESSFGMEAEWQGPTTIVLRARTNP